MDPMTQNTRLSVAITNYNGGRDLLDTIAGCMQAENVDLEIVVSDDGSTDESVKMVKERFPDVKVVELGRNTKRLNIVRNTGIKAAAHDLVLLIDNDITLEPDVIGRLVGILESRWCFHP